MGYFICPYCDKECEPDCEPDCESRNPSDNYEHECEHYKKNFVYTLDYDIIYYVEKADCLNGEEHKYEEMCSYPEEVFINRWKCSMCEKEIVVEAENE